MKFLIVRKRGDKMQFKSRKKDKPDIIIIPMIDIMFFLLVFFMLSTIHMTNISVVPVQLSSMHNTINSTAESLIFSIDGKGEVFVGDQKVERTLVGKYAQAALAVNSNVLIIVRTDKKSEYNDFSEVVESLKQAGVKRLALAAETRY